MKIEEYELGQKVSLYGVIEAIDIEDIYDKENTTTLKISTLARTISINPKWEKVITDIDQPKQVVPQFVADWYEEHKDKLEVELLFLCWKIREIYAKGDFEKWFEKYDKSIQTLVNMHHFGYTVEKEKLYQIIDKRLDVTFNCLGYVIEDGDWFWANKKAFLSDKNVRLDHTQQQLIDAGFEEVFENPNYEVKEVTK